MLPVASRVPHAGGAELLMRTMVFIDTAACHMLTLLASFASIPPIDSNRACALFRIWKRPHFCLMLGMGVVTLLSGPHSGTSPVNSKSETTNTSKNDLANATTGNGEAAMTDAPAALKGNPLDALAMLAGAAVEGTAAAAAPPATTGTAAVDTAKDQIGTEAKGEKDTNAVAEAEKGEKEADLSDEKKDDGGPADAVPDVVSDAVPEEDADPADARGVAPREDEAADTVADSGKGETKSDASEEKDVDEKKDDSPDEKKDDGDQADSIKEDDKEAAEDRGGSDEAASTSGQAEPLKADEGSAGDNAATEAKAGTEAEAEVVDGGQTESSGEAEATTDASAQADDTNAEAMDVDDGGPSIETEVAGKKADGGTETEKVDVDGEEEADGKHSEMDVDGTDPAAAASTAEGENTTPQDASVVASTAGVEKKDEAGEGAASSSAPPPPLLKGTLSYNVERRVHRLQGMWNYENSNAFPAQRFELIRNLRPDEDPTELPKDGEFHGSFSLAYFHVTSKGKRKERSKVIPESGVKIKFMKKDSFGKEFDVDGLGTNQFGIFSIIGTAKKSEHEGDSEYHVELRKKYVPAPGASSSAPAPAPAAAAASGGSNVNVSSVGDELPPPSESYPTNVVCLRGKLARVEVDDPLTGGTVHRIAGSWSSGLNLLESDPDNFKGLCNKFEYEHRAMVATDDFPVSGKYAGWFYVTGEDGNKTQIMERDVTLKFRLNSDGYHNVEGRGSNVFGKYSITGTLTKDHIITIFRHFKPIKIKTKVTAAPGPLKSATAKSAKPAEPDGPPPVSLDDVMVPGDDNPDEPLQPIANPEHGLYSAVSRGVLRINDDGAHTCSGKWAVTREHYTNGQTSNFHFGLEAHHAQQAAEAMKSKAGDGGDGDKPDDSKAPVGLSPVPPSSLGTTTFPVDSANYKGSFKMRRGATKYQSIIDRQIVLKFRKNVAGSYNVYGAGTNSIGKFNLIGTLILSGKGSGHVELYRIYSVTPGTSAAPKPKRAPSASASIPKPSSSLVRRESTRAAKPTSRLDDDDPESQRKRVMLKCDEILKAFRDKDKLVGSIFAEPVDPIALGIPTYPQIITNPMDLGTIQAKMDAEEISTVDEFAQLMRLVFENALKFNADRTSPVHQSAKNFLSMFNSKIADVERVDKARKLTKEEIRDAKRKEKEAAKEEKRREKKRKKGIDDDSTPKRAKVETPASLAAANERALAAIVAAAPADHGNVTRSEFNLLVETMRSMQHQIVQMHSILSSRGLGGAPGYVPELPTPAARTRPAPVVAPVTAFEPVMKSKPKKSKTKKSKAPPTPVFVEESPLTFEEQEELTDAINNISADMLTGIIQIIRESATVADDEDEIDLEIDALDTATQRKLQRFVMKNVKKKKKKRRATPAPAAPSPTPAVGSKGKSSKPKSSSDPSDSFFSFGEQGDSDSESNTGRTNKANIDTFGGKGFSLGDDDAMHDDGDDADLGTAANWNIAKSQASATSNDAGDDDAWGAARKEAAASKAREADREAREAKLMAEAEAAQKQNMAAAAARGEEIRAQRLEKEAEEERRKEDEERAAEAAREAAREKAREQVESVEQTVDLDAQRDIMRQYEQQYEELGGSASPSSDFGF